MGIVFMSVAGVLWGVQLALALPSSFWTQEFKLAEHLEGEVLYTHTEEVIIFVNYSGSHFSATPEEEEAENTDLGSPQMLINLSLRKK